jgi:hypothetical protein
MKRASRVPPSRFYTEIPQALRDIGPMGAEELAKLLLTNAGVIRQAIQRLRARGEPICVRSWYAPQIKGQKSRVFGVGTKDMPRPKPVPEYLQKRERYARNRLERRIKESGARSHLFRLNNPFGLTHDQL